MAKKHSIISIIILSIIMGLGSIVSCATYTRYLTSYNKVLAISITEPTYTIIFNANSGEGSMENEEFTYGTAKKLTVNAFTKYGYIFTKWTTNQNGTGDDFLDEEEVLNLTNENEAEINLYANYENIINMRITDASLLANSNATSNNLKFDFENLTSTVNLSNSSSYVTYEIDITNYLNKDMGIFEITGLPNNLEYEIVNDYEVKQKLCNKSTNESGNTNTIQLRIKYKNGGYVSGSTTYNLDLDFVYKEVYKITYENIYTANNYPNGVITGNYPTNINEITYPSEIMADDSIEVEFYPHVPTTLDVTNTVTYEYDKPTITLSNPTGDIVIDSTTEGEFIMFDHPDVYTFSGSNYLDTQIPLLSQANINKDFKITLYINNYENNQNNLETLFNMMNEAGSPWPGFILRIDGGRYLIQAHGGTTNADINYDLGVLKKLEIYKINGILYYKVNDGSLTQFNDYGSFNSYMNVTATFGGSKDGNGNPMRYFRGAMSQMEIRYLDNTKTVNYYNEVKPHVVYEHTAKFTFNDSNRLDTGIRLFNQENFDRDFEITMNIDSMGSNTGQNQNTLLNSMYEVAGNGENMSDYPGFAFRVENGQYFITANGDESKVTIDVNDQNRINTIKFIRENKVLYYQINNGNRTQLYDYKNGKTIYFDTQVTFGASYDGNGNVWRQFSGELSNMTITLYY